MPIYRVRWEEQKSIVVKADDEEHAQHLAYDFYYEKATTEEQDEIGVYEVDGPNGGEQVWTDDETELVKVFREDKRQMLVNEQAKESGMAKYDVLYKNIELRAHTVAAKDEDEARLIVEQMDWEQLRHGEYLETEEPLVLEVTKAV